MNRFTDNEDGTVSDTETGLMWTKDANLFEAKKWQEAIDCANSLQLCGYTNWRLPTIKEFLGLVDYSQYNPALLPKHPFLNIQFLYYWSVTSYAGNPGSAWVVDMRYGNVYNYYKSSFYAIWPVRGHNK